MSRFNKMEIPEIDVTPVPKGPKFEKLVVEGKEYAATDLDGMNDLIAMRDIAKRNTEMLKEMATANQFFIQERNHLLGLATELEHRANIMAQQWADTEEQRRQAEDIRAVERALYQAVLLLGIILL